MSGKSGRIGIVRSRGVSAAHAPELEVQLKATGPLAWKAGEAPFRLKRKNYDDLRMPRATPAILVVREMPDSLRELMERARRGRT